MRLARPAVRPALVPALAIVALGLVTLLATWLTGGLSRSLIEPDEGGHYVNALFLGDWLRAGLPSPMPFARGFYAHFPRLSIGHWPPGWYMLEAPVFALFRPSPAEAAVASAFIAGLPGVAVLWSFGRLGRPRVGFALALAYALLPLSLDSARYLLVDQPLALVTALAVIAWARACERPHWGRCLLFGALAAFCPLVKGNGAAIALVPAIDIALTGRWRLLREPWVWAAGLLAMLVVAPWYWLSFRISAEGFNYQPGLAYAWLALRTNWLTIAANIGWGGLLLAVGGSATVWVGGAEQRRLARLALAVVIATLAFQSAVPASLAARYMAPLLPWAVVLVGLGGLALWERGYRARVAAAVLGASAVIPASLGLARLSPKPDISAPVLAGAMAAKGGLWLVDGRSGAEGALIAQAAWADRGRRGVWIARASQWLSTSDFMGRGYRLTAPTPAAARTVLDRLGAAGVASVAIGGRFAYPHSRVLAEAVTQGYADRRMAFATGYGRVLTATRLTPARPDTALLETDPMSSKAGKMVAALD